MFVTGNGPAFHAADIEGARSIDDLARVLNGIASLFSFRESSIYGDLPDGGRMVQPLRIISTQPPSFHAELDAINANGGDDFLARVWSSDVPSWWDMTNVQGKANPVFATALALLFERYSITCGINIPITSQRGRKRVVSFSGNRGPMGESEVEQLHYLSIILINRFEEIEDGQWNRDGEEVNDMERRFLQLFADGLDNEMLADRFRLSPSTVNFILESGRRKLGCASLTHAVAEGLRRGIIE